MMTVTDQVSSLFRGMIDIVKQYSEVCGAVSVHIDILLEYIGCVSHGYD